MYKKLIAFLFVVFLAQNTPSFAEDKFSGGVSYDFEFNESIEAKNLKEKLPEIRNDFIDLNYSIQFKPLDLLSIDDENAVGHMKMGILYHSQQDIKNAEDSLLKAISLDDSLIDAKYYLALIYETHDKEKANKLYQEILEQDPTYKNARLALTEISVQDN